jgi:hypothetical protein
MTKRDQIAGLVGEDAADLALRANKWMMRAISAAVPIPILAVLSSILHVPQLWLLVPICGIAAIGMSIPGARLDNQAGRAASAYLSHSEGVPLTVKSGGMRLWVWQKEIERAHQRLAAESRQSENQATADLRNRHWLDRKQEKWEEYRQQHPQDPGQGG